MTRALVTGAAGFIGSHVVRALAGRCCEVVATDRPGAAWQRLSNPPGTIDEADLENPGAAAALIGRRHPDLLVHLAWHTAPDRYLTSRDNLDSLAASADLVALAVSAGCRRVVGAGTCLEYPPSQLPHRESDSAGPDTLYGACKHAARIVAERLSADAGASFAWARVFHLHGPGEDQRRLLPMVAEKLRRGEFVQLSPGEQLRDYLRVEDVADAIATIALSGATGAVNICSGTSLTLRRILETLADAVGHRDRLRFGALPYRPGERLVIAGEPAVLRSLGWTPFYAQLRASLAYFAEGAA